MAKWKKRHARNIELIETEGEKTERHRIKLTKFLKREMVITALSIMVVTIATIGGSYAVFSNIAKAKDYNVVKAGTLQIAYDDTSSGLGNIINLNGAYPEPDSKGQEREPYKFKITNIGSLKALYKVKIIDDAGMIEEDGCTDKLLDKAQIKYSINGQEGKILDEVKEEYIVVEGSLGAGESVVYEIRMWINENAGNEVLGKHYHGKIVVEGVQDDRETATDYLIAKANNEMSSYDTVSAEEKKEMFTFTHEAGEQQAGWSAEELKDYRYIGTSPNNYVTFNEETWRIIGVFTVEDEAGRKEKRVKLIRDESIGNYSWDNQGENGENDWSTSALQKVLNSGAYYTRTSGDCPNGQNGATTACDFTSNGLTETAKSMIGSTKWYLGGHNFDDLVANFYYKAERGTTVYSERSTSWIGEVGLMYPSDYGYATSGSSCLNTNLNGYSSSCASTDWLSNSSMHQWTIAPLSGASYGVLVVNSSGDVSYDATYDTSVGVRPSIYLKSSVEVSSGDGSRENPYTFVMS